MSKYIGQPCTSCRNVFKEGDEIVVCPDCGSPYHRECYKNEGRCINTVLHESGESWTPAPIAAPAASVDGGEKSELICSNCGAHNKPSSYYCSECGAPLSAEARSFGTNSDFGRNNGPYGGNFGPRDATGMPYFVNVRTIAAETDVDGNTVGEYSEYVGAKSFYYIPKFLRFAKSGSKLSFNFAAFFFPQFWFAYRKMPLISAITIVLTTLIGIPAAMESLSAFGFGEFAFMSSPAFAVVYNICFVLSYAISIFCGVFANYIYYRKAKSDIDKLKSQSDGSLHISAAIKQQGGVSMPYFAMAIAAELVLSMILSFFMSF